MNNDTLFRNIQKKKSYLCVGLDSDIDKIPTHLKALKDPVLEFNKQIIDATAPFAVAFKPNLAFYESRGIDGWKDLEATAKYIKSHYPDVFLIADAKRGDIGNTSKMYARAFFETMDFDAVTVAPYMGEDSVSPFLNFIGKYIIILALTSNPGASDFQSFTSKQNQPLFQEVIKRSKSWGDINNIMYVVGATKAGMLVPIREQIPDHFLLVPGVGAQGGSLEEVAKYGMNKQCGLLVNASRSIIFASSGKDFAEAAGEESKKMQKQMEQTLQNAGLI
jgi:orotidine-5'-phosphate decarboxylase